MGEGFCIGYNLIRLSDRGGKPLRVPQEPYERVFGLRIQAEETADVARCGEIGEPGMENRTIALDEGRAVLAAGHIQHKSPDLPGASVDDLVSDLAKQTYAPRGQLSRCGGHQSTGLLSSPAGTEMGGDFDHRRLQIRVGSLQFPLLERYAGSVRTQNGRPALISCTRRAFMLTRLIDEEETWDLRCGGIPGARELELQAIAQDSHSPVHGGRQGCYRSQAAARYLRPISLRPRPLPSHAMTGIAPSALLCSCQKGCPDQSMREPR